MLYRTTILDEKALALTSLGSTRQPFIHIVCNNVKSSLPTVIVVIQLYSVTMFSSTPSSKYYPITAGLL